MERDVLDDLRVVTAAMDEKKAFSVLALDVGQRTSIADAFVLCSVGSSRQAQAVADEIDRRLAEVGRRALAVEGYNEGGWILIDYGDFVIHVFTEERREFYGLERLWGDAPVVTPELRRAAP